MFIAALCLISLMKILNLFWSPFHKNIYIWTMQTQGRAQHMSNVEAIPLAWWIHFSQKLASANLKLDLIRKPKNGKCVGEYIRG